jgi:hypothetical protein
VSNVRFFECGRNADQARVSLVVSEVTSGTTHDGKLQSAGCLIVTCLGCASTFTMKVVCPRSKKLGVVYRVIGDVIFQTGTSFLLCHPGYLSVQKKN